MPHFPSPRKRVRPPRTTPGDAAVARVEAAFTDEYARLLPKARSYALKMVPEAFVDDVVQGSFARLWEACYMDGELPNEPASALLFEILRGRIADQLRHAKAEQERDEQHVIDIADRLTPRLSATRVADGNLLAERINYLVACLPERSRRVFQIAFDSPDGAKAASEQLGIPYNTARWLLLEAKHQIRETLIRDGYDVPGFAPRGPSAGRIQ